MPKKSVLVPLANGCEELEAVTVIDVLRRAACLVTVASCHDLALITASRGTRIMADCLLLECSQKNWDMIALPGGMPGAENLRDNALLINLLETQKQNSQWIAAICAAPAIVLAQHQLISAAKTTCYPSFIESLPNPVNDPTQSVVVDSKERIITSRGPGTALGFALELVRQLVNPDTAEQLAVQMLVHDWQPSKTA